MSIRKKSPNYDPIAKKYNRRYRQDQRQGTLNALRRILSEKSPERVLEVGCGTCHWLGLLSDSRLHKLVGVDKSIKMLNEAAPSNQLLLCQGAAENLPLRNEAFDFIFCVNAIHHFFEPKMFIIQTGRLLKAGGTLGIIGMNPHDNRNQWYIYDFFEGTLARDLTRFPDWTQLQRWMQDCGLINIHLQDIDIIHDPKSPSTVLEDPFLDKHACSQLALLSAEEYQLGLIKLRDHIKFVAGTSYRYKNDIILSMLLAHKPNA